MKKFTSIYEMLDDLNKIEPLEKDLSQEQDMDKAVELCKRVLTNIQKAPAKFFDSKSLMKEYSETLIKKGCVIFEHANDCFKTKEASSLAEIIDLQNDINFPLCCFSQLIDSDEKTFMTGINKLHGGWAEQWLHAQGVNLDNENDTNRLIEDDLYMV